MIDLARGVHVAPGDGIVARIGGFVAFARGDDDGLNQLVVRLNALSDAPWPEVVRTITSDIAAAGYSSHPLLACAAVESERVRTLVFGDLQLVVETDTDHQVLDGSESSTWIDVAVRGQAERIECGRPAATAVVGVLRDGVVPGGGFLFDAQAPIPAAVSWTGADAGEVAETATVDASEGEAAATAEQLSPDDEMPDIRSLHELVSSIERETTKSYPEERSMFSRDDEVDGTGPAHAAEISETGGTSELVDSAELETRSLLAGERPSLGVLTFDDGASLQLTRPVVIGRGVPDRYTVDGEPATTVLLDDTQGMISNVHLEVRLVGDAVELVDKHSTSGTFLHQEETGARVQLEPEVSTPIEPHTLVEVGQRTFTFTLD